MKLNLTSPLYDLTSQPLIGEGGAPLLLRTVLQNAALATLPDDQGLSGADKARLYRLAIEANAGEVEWPVEDVSLLKQRVGAAYGPIVVGQVWPLLEGGA
jgi:hypothetical protein